MNAAAPYPPMNADVSSPYPPQAPQTMYPPSYNEAVSQVPYQKQAPYNPSYPGN